MVLEAWDAHASRQEHKPLLIQADLIGEKVTSIQQGMEALSIGSLNEGVAAGSGGDGDNLGTEEDVVVGSGDGDCPCVGRGSRERRWDCSRYWERSLRWHRVWGGSSRWRIDWDDRGSAHAQALPLVRAASSPWTQLGEPATQKDAKTATKWCGTRVLRQSEESAQRSPDYRIIPGNKGGAPSRVFRAAKGSQQQLARRSQRLLSKETLPPERDNTRIRHTIYVLGDLPQDAGDLSEWDQLLYNFHTGYVLQDTVDDRLMTSCGMRSHGITSNGPGRPQDRPLSVVGLRRKRGSVTWLGRHGFNSCHPRRTKRAFVALPWAV